MDGALNPNLTFKADPAKRGGLTPRWNPEQVSLSRVVIQIRTIKLKEENARGLH
jgi:hypothetical protein